LPRKKLRSKKLKRLTLAAAGMYAGMIATFFVFNNPVNNTLNRWTAATLPADWPAHRLRWESGHALAALLSTSDFRM
jgi:hypothetical protein